MTGFEDGRGLQAKVQAASQRWYGQGTDSLLRLTEGPQPYLFLVCFILLNASS